MRYYKRTKGFTLLELSIVIVIIGLIVAGISAGQSLVRQASIRSLLADSNNYRTAYNTFKLQYDAIAGDMINAHDYWGSSCNADADTCNGDGDKIIDFVQNSDTNESYMFWHHLSLANLLDGTFTGITETPYCNASNNTSVPDINVVGTGFAGVGGDMLNNGTINYIRLADKALFFVMQQSAF